MNQQGQLGQIVTWRVPSEVSLDQLREALRSSGLEPDLARDLHPRHVLTRALGEMRKGRVICRLESTSSNSVAFQLTRESAGADSVDYYREATVTMDLRTGVPVSDSPEIEGRARELVREHTAKRLTSDMTRLVQRLYDEHKADLVPIREQGGAYFVPDQHRALVDQTRTFLAAIGGRVSSFAVRLGCADTAQSVAESLTEHLSGLIAAFRESCEGVTGDSRSDVVQRRHERVGEIRRKLESYRGLMGACAERIDAEVDRAERVLLAGLTGTGPGPGTAANLTDAA